MGLFSGLFKKKSTEKEYTSSAVLENNFIGGIENPKWADVHRYMDMMFENDEEYVTLTLVEAVDGVRFMQACSSDKGYMLQLGIEEEDSTNLVEMVCDKKAVQKHFKEFFANGRVADREKFAPTEFKL